MKKWVLVLASASLLATFVGACADGSTDNNVTDDDAVSTSKETAKDSGKGKSSSTSTTLPTTDDVASNGTDETGTDDTGFIFDSGVGDSGKGSTDSGVPQTSVDCDTSNPLNSIKYAAEALSQDVPVPCPCNAGQCCYSLLTCVDL